MSETQPQVIEGPEAWHGRGMASDLRWQFQLSDEDIGELEAALETVRRRELAWRELTTKADFPLNCFAEKLERVAEELEEGGGMVKMKGFPVERFNDEDLNRIWYGVCLNLGTPIYQNYHGELLRNIVNEQQDTDAVNDNRLFAKDGSVFHSSRARTASSGPLRFHTDRADVVGLFCIQQAAKGGISQLASSVRVNNEIVKRRPDLAALLYDVIHRSRHGEEKDGRLNIYGIPVFAVRDGKFTSHYSRTYVEAAQELDTVPRMSDAQWEALDFLAEVAGEVCMEMSFEPGDIQLVNNHVIYHARTAYEDGAERRCLKRIWLSMPNSRALPEDQAALWRNVEPGALRGGIVQA
jgi:hypothetical protein